MADRGGLPEVCGSGGLVVKLPDDLTLKRARPVEAEAVAEWFDLITRLYDEEEYYARVCKAAFARGASYYPDHLAPRYREFFSPVAHA